MFETFTELTILPVILKVSEHYSADCHWKVSYSLYGINLESVLKFAEFSNLSELLCHLLNCLQMKKLNILS